MQAEHHQAIEDLYRDAVALADQARGWFDGPGVAWRATLDLADQARVATESLATTTRLLAIITWALDPRHMIRSAPLLPFVWSDADVPVVAPLIGRPGGDIASAARRLTARAAALTAHYPPEPLPAANMWRLA